MHDFNPEHIAELMRSTLPGHASHLKMVPPGRRIVADESDQARQSSVLLLLFPYKGRVYTCLTKRSSDMKNHPGQISLPGGRMEEGELPEMTALREAREEVGIKTDDVSILGRLSELYVQISRYKIYPFVGWVDYKPDFILNTDEAEKVILFPVQDFVERYETRQIPIQTSTGVLNVPCFTYEDEVIWGATAMILSEFFDVLKQPQFTVSQ